MFYAIFYVFFHNAMQGDDGHNVAATSSSIPQ